MWRSLAAIRPIPTPWRAKPCRRSVKRRLAMIAAAQSYPVLPDTEADMAAIAGQCANCGACPKFAAGISFMLLRPGSLHRSRRAAR